MKTEVGSVETEVIVMYVLMFIYSGQRKHYYLDEVANTQWILTAPAIWDDVAKDCIRKCMEEAGLVKKEQLIVVYEHDTTSFSVYNHVWDISIICLV